LIIALKNKEVNLELAYYKHMADKKKQPAGATAPVSGSTKTGGGSDEDYSYQEVKDSDPRDLVKGLKVEG
jgi:hypothetical protein